MDIKNIRTLFPIFRKDCIYQDSVYLDSAATTQKPASVIKTIADFYMNENATVHRGVYELSERSTERYEKVRSTIARFINAQDTSEIIFIPLS